MNNTRILVVEDEPSIREHLVVRISRAGFTNVGEAVNGRDALQQLREGTTGLVISDLQMPRMNGLDLLTNMKKDPTLANIPFILMSGLMNEETKSEGMHLGAAACMFKLDMRDAKLLEVIQRVLGTK